MHIINGREKRFHEIVRRGMLNNEIKCLVKLFPTSTYELTKMDGVLCHVVGIHGQFT